MSASIQFVVYDTTGAILRCGTCEGADLSLQAGSGETAMEGTAGDLTHYVDTTTDQITSKQALALTSDKATIAADAIEIATIASVPAGVTVQVVDGGSPQPVVDGLVEFDTDQPGTYVLHFEGVRYLPQEITIEALTPP